MATIKDVAKEAGVSVATVSHVINGTRYVSPELTQKVEEAMEKLDYHPNAVARSLKTKRTNTIGLIVSDITNPFFSTLVRGVEDAAMENDHSVIVCNTDETLSKEKLYLDVLLQRKIDGLIIAPTGQSDENLQLLIDQNIPFVFVDRKMDGIEADAVLSQNVEGAYKAVKYLIEGGHKKIGIILGLKKVSTSEERFEGYRKALKEAGIEEDQDLIVRGNYKIDGGARACQQLLALNESPTAFFVTNNQMTLGVLKTVKEIAPDLMREIFIACFDDLEWVDIFDIPLTTVVQQPWEMGYKSAKILLNRIEEGGVNKAPSNEIRLGVDLKVRMSRISETNFTSHPNRR